MMVLVVEGVVVMARAVERAEVKGSEAVPNHAHVLATPTCQRHLSPKYCHILVVYVQHVEEAVMGMGLGVEGAIVMAVTGEVEKVEVAAVVEATMTVEVEAAMATAEAVEVMVMMTATETEVVEVATADVVLVKGATAAIENEMVAALASLHLPLSGALLAMLAIYIPQHLLNSKQIFSFLLCQTAH